MITKDAGDIILISKDGLRKLRFDIKNPHRDVPHIHIEMLKNGKWKNALSDVHRLYPKKSFPMILEQCYKSLRFRIEGDEPSVGFYLCVYNDDGWCEADYLQDTLVACKEFAFEEYGVPMDVWREEVNRDLKNH